MKRGDYLLRSGLDLRTPYGTLLRDEAFAAARQTSTVASAHDRFGAEYQGILRDPEANRAFFMTVLDRHPVLAGAWKNGLVDSTELPVLLKPFSSGLSVTPAAEFPVLSTD